MTLIPRQQEKNCFITCSDDKVKSGLCDCINRMQNQALNIPIVVGQSEQLCQCEDAPIKHFINNWCDDCQKHIV